MPDDWLRKTRYGFWLDARHWFQRGQRITVARGPYAGRIGIVSHRLSPAAPRDSWGYALRDLDPRLKDGSARAKKLTPDIAQRAESLPGSG